MQKMNVVKRMVAVLLTLVLVMSGIIIPKLTPLAATSEIDLSSYITMSGTTSEAVKDGSAGVVELMINLPSDMDEKAEWDALGITDLTVEFTVSEYTTTNAYPGAMLFFMASGSSKWNQGTWADMTASGTLTSTLDVENLDWGNGTKVGELGLQMCNLTEGTTVTYSISSIKFTTGEASSDSESDSENTEIPTGSQTSSNGSSDTVKATIIENVSSDGYWYEYAITVSNSSSSSICGWVIKAYLPGVDISSAKTFDTCNLTYVDGYLYIEGIGDGSVVAAGSNNATYSVKIGNGSSLGLDTSDITAITYEYGTEANTGLDDFEFNYTLTGQTKDLAFEDTPVGRHGKLHVDGIYLYDENNEKFQLRGASLHGIQWDVGYNYINKGAFQSLRDEWGINAIRLPVYVTQSGYTEGASATMDTYIQNAVNYATELGMYVLIDWHVHSASGETTNPNTWKTQANTFFDKYASMYKDYENVLFEICNEPVNTPWYDGSGNDIYSYANTIIPTIRQYTDAVVIVGTNTWSQDVDLVSSNKLSTTNTMYTIHFYSATHMTSIRSKVQTALNAGVPVFCTEFGVCSADGNGSYNLEEADAWMDLFDQYSISYFCWQLSNKDEKSSYLATTSTKTTGGWVNSDLSTTGMWLINENRPKADAEDEKYESTDPVAVTGITLSTNDLKINVGESSKLTATVEPTNATNKNYTWKSNNTDVATVDASGNVKGISPGNTAVIVTTADGGKTATCSVSVYGTHATPAAPTVASKTANSVTLNTVAGCHYSIDGVNWQASATFYGLTPNTEYTFYQKLLASGYYYDSAASAGTKVTTDKIYATSLTLDKTSVKLEIGGDNETLTGKLTATITPDNATTKTVTWSSSNKNVATVDTSGNVTAVGAGTATITAQVKDGGSTQPSAICTVTVWKTPEVPTQSPSTSTTPTKDTVTLTQYDNCEYRVYKDGAWSDWQDSNVFTGLEPDTEYTFEIRVKADEANNIYAGEAVTITVSTLAEGETAVAVTGVAFDNKLSESCSITIGDCDSWSFPATVSPENATDKTITYTSSNPEVATIDENGKVIALAPGYTELSVTTKTGGFTDTIKLSVYKKYDTPAAPTLASKTTTTVTLGKVEGCKYSMDKTNWQDSNVFTGLTADTSYTFYVKKTANGYWLESDLSTGLTVTTDKETTGSTGGDTGNTGGDTGSTGGDTGNTGGDTGNTGGDTGSTGGDTGNTGNVGGSTGDDTGNAGGDTGSTGGNTGSTGGDTGSTGGNTGSTGGDTGGTGGNTGNTGGSTSGDTGNAGGTTSENPFVAPDIKVSYRTHIQTFGWEGNADDITTWKSDGTMSGTSGLAKRLEGINIVVEPTTASDELDLGIQYTTHCQSYGWLPWSADGDMNGTEGEAKRLEAIMIQLTGEHANLYDVYYRVHAQSYGWLGWAKNGEPAGTAGYAKRLEGIQIVVVKKGEGFNQNMEGITSVKTEAFVAKAGSSPIVNYPATSNTNPVVPGAEDVNVAYRTHVQSFGWQGWKYNGQMSGTSGLAKRLEGIEINLTNKDYEGGVAYATHVQTYGWQGANLDDPTTWKQDGQMAGTSGEAKRLEAICITLTGDMAEHYDIYYRVHAQSYGWLGWAKNGAPAGTAGYAKRLEGIQIVVVPKRSGTPANTYMGVTSVTANSYIEK